MSQDPKEYMKAYYQANKEEMKARSKAYYQAHKEERKAWYQAHKKECNARNKAWQEAHKEDMRAYQKAYQKAYKKADVNSLGQSKSNIRKKSQHYLNKYGTKIPGYQIHHCCTYNEPYKFIYCSKEMHLKIHQYLRDNNIEADSDHYAQIKHLLDNTVVIYGLD